VLLMGEPAWARFFAEFRAFVGVRPTPANTLAQSGLTDSELKVLELMARGLDNAAIAAALRKSEKTVRNQVSSIFAKLEVNTRARAIVLARDAGLGKGE